jgi:hypothetical protein
MRRGSPTEVIGVDIAQRNDVFRLHRLQVARASSTGANDGDVEPLVQIPASQNGWRSERCSAGNCRRTQEAPTIH